MKTKFFILTAIIALSFGGYVTAPLVAGLNLTTANSQLQTTVVIHAKGAIGTDIQLRAIMDNITYVTWVLVTSELTAADLSGAKMLIMVKNDVYLNYTEAELNAIKDWFDEGGKAIWVTGDSDYGLNYGDSDYDLLRQSSANEVLAKIGSVLRIEECSIEDPVTNAGENYRVYGLSEKCDEEVDFLVGGVNSALFHGPAPIIAYQDGEYISIEQEKPVNVYRVMWTSGNATIANYNPPDPQVHSVGENGNFVLMAVEVNYAKKNVVIVTGDAPFDHYTGMYEPELYNYERYMTEYPQEGEKLFKNIIEWVAYYSDKMMSLQNQVIDLNDQIDDLQGQMTSLQQQVADLTDQVTGLQTAVSTWQGVSAGAFVIGLVAGVVVIYILKRR